MNAFIALFASLFALPGILIVLVCVVDAFFGSLLEIFKGIEE